MHYKELNALQGEFHFLFPPVWISLYYLAFYVVMTGLFALSIYSLMRTVNPYEPDYQDQLKSPGTAAAQTIPATLNLILKTLYQLKKNVINQCV